MTEPPPALSGSRRIILGALQTVSVASGLCALRFGLAGDAGRFAFCLVLAVYGLVWCERLLPTRFGRAGDRRTVGGLTMRARRPKPEDRDA